MRSLATLILLFVAATGYCQKLVIVDQDYEKAKTLAHLENKLLFIDFYTTWCAPCKKLDKLIFQNDTISQMLADDFVLLRYDAEQDKEYHLSKKHHVNSYPTGIILNNEGFVVTRQYGFVGEEVHDLSESVFAFTEKSIKLDREDKSLPGYSTVIDTTIYPRFYIDYVNRDLKKVANTSEFDEYWRNTHDILAEGYFSTLVYFAQDVPITIADEFLLEKTHYIELYGKTDVDVALMFMSFGKFDDAIDNRSQEKFDQAVEFMHKALDDKTAQQMLPMFTHKFNEVKYK